jgi:excisionase family DNA binding protein
MPVRSSKAPEVAWRRAMVATPKRTPEGAGHDSEVRPLLVSIRRSQDITGLSRSAIWRKIKSGELRAVRAGGRTMLDYAALEAWAAGLPVWGQP